MAVVVPMTGKSRCRHESGHDEHGAEQFHG
jgi:hypothetical protein